MPESSHSDERARGNLKRLGTQIGNYGVGILIPAILSLLSSALFTRMFPTDEYGNYAIVLSLATFFTSLVGQWIQQPLGRWLAAATSSEREPLFRATWLAFGFIAFGLFVLGGLAQCLITIPHAFRPYYWVTVCYIWLQILFTTSALIFQASLRAASYALYQVTFAVLRLALSFVFCSVLFHSPVGLMWGTVVATLCVVPIMLFKTGMLRAILNPGRNASQPIWSTFRRMSQYGLPMLGWFAAANVLSTSDRLVIAAYRGNAEAGVYTANYNLVSGTVGLVTAPVLAALWPFLMTSWNRGSRRETGRWLGTIVSLMVAAGVLLCGAIWAIAKEAAVILLGPAFREGAGVLPIVVGGVVLSTVGTYTHKPFEFCGRTYVMMWLALITAASNVVLNLLFVPRWGYMAAAWSTLACYALYALLTAILSQRLLRWHVSMSPIVTASLASASGVSSANIVSDCLHWTGFGVPLIQLFIKASVFTMSVTIVLTTVYRRKLVTYWYQVRAARSSTG
ncbi:MAG: oligosaccharide flippase family protein [Alicyclobacillus macrosporangiidus]|nr:oligosaccharide flippase family protein [Alicyclobacillus macrosporangiidus]